MQTPSVPAKILRVPDVIEMLGISRSTLYARIKSGHLQKPIKLGPRLSGWRLSEIQEFIDLCDQHSRRAA